MATYGSIGEFDPENIDNTVQVDTQRGNKRRGPRKSVETLTASGVGVLHKVVKLFLRF